MFQINIDKNIAAGVLEYFFYWFKLHDLSKAI